MTPTHRATRASDDSIKSPPNALQELACLEDRQRKAIRSTLGPALHYRPAAQPSPGRARVLAARVKSDLSSGSLRLSRRHRLPGKSAVQRSLLECVTTS